MKIALVGGTGDIGTGFALRWAANHEIIIGSRKAEKAVESALKITEALGGGSTDIRGTDNGAAVEAAEMVMLCVPYEHLTSATMDLRDSYSSQIVVSPVVPMSYNGKFFQFAPPKEGSAAMQARSLLPEGMRVVSAFHTVCAAALQDVDRELRADVPICGDDEEAINLVSGLIQEIKSLRPLKAGPLAVSSMIESLTPMLLNVARRNRIRDAGIKIISERPATIA
jgi:NADPH-dependent F420 reductase